MKWISGKNKRCLTKPLRHLEVFRFRSCIHLLSLSSNMWAAHATATQLPKLSSWFDLVHVWHTLHGYPNYVTIFSDCCLARICDHLVSKSTRMSMPPFLLNVQQFEEKQVSRSTGRRCPKDSAWLLTASSRFAKDVQTEFRDWLLFEELPAQHWVRCQCGANCLLMLQTKKHAQNISKRFFDPLPLLKKSLSKI